MMSSESVHSRMRREIIPTFFSLVVCSVRGALGIINEIWVEKLRRMNKSVHTEQAERRILESLDVSVVKGLQSTRMKQDTKEKG